MTEYLSIFKKRLGSARVHNLFSIFLLHVQIITKLETKLNRLKDRKPELLTITAQEQLDKLKGQLATIFIRWLIE